MLFRSGAQGYLRDFKNGEVKLRPPSKFKELLKMFKIVFLDENELRSLKKTKAESIRDVFRRLSLHKLEEIVVTCGDRGSWIYSAENKLYKIKAYPPYKVSDPTGLGDTYLAAYLSCKRNDADIFNCGEFAARLATIKLENKKSWPDLLNQGRFF